ncbi:MAG: ATP-binding protein [Gammaproteobacteria bacterium]|jgi:ATP-dependent DNA helicase RecG
MELKEIKSLVQQGESNILEFKKSTAKLKEAFQSLCGMLNGLGGQILIGVTDSGKIVGQTVSDNTKKEMAEYIKKIEPSANIVIEYVSFRRNLSIIILTALSAQNIQKPYVYNGRPYQRIESTSVIMKQSKYHEMLSLKKSCFSEWEASFVTSDCELDSDRIRRMIKVGIKAGRIPNISGYNDHEDILERLGLMRSKKITNAAAILFGTNIEVDYPQCLIKLARFKGEDKLQGFIDNKQFYGNAFEVLDYAENFLKTYLPISSVFKDDSLQRKDELAIPFLALREAIVNAVCHRDYSDRSGEINIAIYDSYVEIWNKGKLPDSLTIDDLTKKHASCPRNKLISEIFYKCGYIEKWGSGTLRILKLCKDKGLPEPKFSEYSGGVSIEFLYRKTFISFNYDECVAMALQECDEKLKIRGKEILKILFEFDQLTSTAILSKMEHPPSERTLRNDLVYLQKLGLVARKGAGSNVTWYLVQEPKKE